MTNRYLKGFLNELSTSPVQKPVEVEQFGSDKKRSAILSNESQLIEELLEGLEIPDRTKDLLSLNISTSAVSADRPVPSRVEKIQALFDFWKFLKLINFHGGPLAFAECHRELVAWKFRPYASFRSLVLMPRGHLKSTILSVAYSLWRIYQNPNIRLFVGCESLKLSKAFIREVESYLVDDWNKENVWNSRPHIEGQLIPDMDSLGKQRRSLIRDVSSEFGDEFSITDKANTKKKVWRAEALQVVRSRVLKEPTLTAGSVGQTSTGFHFDEIIFDDVHTFENCSSETKIQKTYSWIYDIESVLDDPYIDVELVQQFKAVSETHFNSLRNWAISGGRMSVIGTRYDDMDYYGHIIENADELHFEVYQKNIYQNGIDNSDGYLWPEKWNEEVEKYKRAQFERAFGATGLARFYSQYYNRIEDFEDAVLDWQKINFLQPNQIKLDDDGFVTIFNYDHSVLGRFKPRLIVDPTSTASKKSDFCAMVVGGKIEDKLMVIDFWMRREKPEVWLKQLYEFVDKWNLHEAVVEMVGGFKILEFTIKQMWIKQPEKYRPISVKSYNPPTNTGDGKINRIETVLSPVVSNGLLHLPLYVSKNEELSKQFRFFGKDTTKDDGVDVLAILYEKAFQTKDTKQRRRKSMTMRTHPIHGGVVYHDFGRQETFYDKENRWGSVNVG